MSKSTDRKSDKPITVAIIGGIFVIIAALIGYRGNVDAVERIIQATQTAESRLTALAATAASLQATNEAISTQLSTAPPPATTSSADTATPDLRAQSLQATGTAVARRAAEIASTQTAMAFTPTPAPMPKTNATLPSPPRPAPTAAPVSLPAPRLLSPTDGETKDGRVTFSWQWSGLALAPNQAFEVRMWLINTTEHNGITGPVIGASVEVDLSPIKSGDYLWTVAVIQVNPYQRIGPEAPPHSLHINEIVPVP